jgi:hypothetical protein
MSRRAWFLVLAAVGLIGVTASPAAAQEYSFVKVADSVQDGFDPFGFGCSSVNDRGDVAFRAGRVAEDGFNVTDGIYRVDASDGSLVTIVEDEKRFDFVGRNPSMNDLGEVSFAANLDKGDEAIFRGNGKKLVEIASTADEFNFFGFDTSVNDGGVVAFKAELDEDLGFDEGLFSGSGKRITTHYLASTSQFDGTDSRPSINDLGAIAFEETVDFDSGIFVTAGTGFTTIAAPDPDRSVQEPVLNDGGTAAFETSFFDEATQQFVSAIVTGNGGPLTTVVDTTGPFASFGFRPPALNNGGDVAFLATLDDFTTTGVFVGPDPVADRVIATGDTLDGATVTGLTFCEEGLNDSGQLAFTAFFEDPVTFETRAAVFLATPASTS